MINKQFVEYDVCVFVCVCMTVVHVESAASSST